MWLKISRKFEFYTLPIVENCKISNDNQKNFNKKLFELLNMKQDLYEKKTEQNRNYLISSQNNINIEKLKKEISTLINWQFIN